MNELDVTRKLNSVGKAAFVKYYTMFKSYADGIAQKDSCVNKLVSDKVSNESGASIRLGNAKQIFKAKMERNALEIIVKSNRMEGHIVNQANMLISRVK